jgi:hypothetical protein
MITSVRIREDLQPTQRDWITALRGPAIKALMAARAIQPTLFDDTDMAEITSPDHPAERLIACCNPFLADERARKRGELLEATGAELAKIDAATRRSRRPRRGKDAIALAVGKVVNAKKSPSTSSWTSPTRACPDGTMRTRSPPKPRWTGSTSSAPASPPMR